MLVITATANNSTFNKTKVIVFIYCWNRFREMLNELYGYFRVSSLCCCCITVCCLILTYWYICGGWQNILKYIYLEDRSLLHNNLFNCIIWCNWLFCLWVVLHEHYTICCCLATVVYMRGENKIRLLKDEK